MLARHLLLLGLIASLSSCGFVHRNTIGLFEEPATESQSAAAPTLDGQAPFQSTGLPTSDSKQNTARVAIESLPSDAPPKSDQVEVLWEIPQTPVDKFILRYGSSPDKLDETVEIETEQLSEHDDPAHGAVYRYVLTDIPHGEPVYVSMASVKGAVTSSFSAPFEVGK